VTGILLSTALPRNWPINFLQKFSVAVNPQSSAVSSQTAPEPSA
jgi:hypothetical protein